MPNNTNFQTFHQMGTAINEFVKQATGRDNVQNIDIDHVTVAQNHYYEDVDVSGLIVSFMASASVPLESCIAQIVPVQDLHGYDNPWPGGGGKNKFPITMETQTINGTTFTVAEDGSITISGTPTEQTRIRLNSLSVTPSADMKFSLTGNVQGVRVFCRANDSGAVSYPTLTRADLITGITYDQFALEVGTSFTGTPTILKMQLEEGTTVTDWMPYSNICPITGHTGCNVVVSPTLNAEDGTTYPVSWQTEAGTVYHGHVNLVTGELVADKAGVEITDESNFVWDSNNSLIRVNITGGVITNATTQFNVYTQNSMFRDVSWASRGRVDGAVGIYFGASAIFIKYSQIASVNDAQTFFTNNPMTVVYELAEPQTYQLTPVEIQTIIGQNNIWADTGSIEVKFTDIKELY